MCSEGGSEKTFRPAGAASCCATCVRVNILAPTYTLRPVEPCSFKGYTLTGDVNLQQGAAQEIQRGESA